MEDNPDDVALTERALKKSHIFNKLVVARDGVEALDYLFGTGNRANKDLNTTPDIILLDIKMPRMNGIEVLKNIRSDPKLMLIPVIMVTSSREERDLVESYKLGANSYVVKPVDIAQFIDAIKTLGQYWVVINQLPSLHIN